MHREADRNDGDARRRERIPGRARDHAHSVGRAAVLHRLSARHHGTQTRRSRNCGAVEAFLAETRRLSSTGGFSKRIATGEIIWSEEVYRIFELDPAAPLTLERILTRVHPDDIHSFNEMLDRQQRGSRL